MNGTNLKMPKRTVMFHFPAGRLTETMFRNISIGYEVVVIFMDVYWSQPLALADPGFPVGGVDLIGRASIPNAVMFQKFCMLKRKNLHP